MDRDLAVAFRAIISKTHHNIPICIYIYQICPTINTQTDACARRITPTMSTKRARMQNALVYEPNNGDVID